MHTKLRSGPNMGLDGLLANLQREAGTPGTLGTSQNSNTVNGAAYWRWLIDFSDRNPLEVAFSPAATHAEVLSFYPAALAAQPCATAIRAAASAMTEDEERAVLRWLAGIGEQDPVIITEVLTTCRRDTAAMMYFRERAASAQAGEFSTTPHEKGTPAALRITGNARRGLPLGHALKL